MWIYKNEQLYVRDAVVNPSLKIREEKLGFIMKFAENLVLKLMEDPKERDRRFRELVYRVKDRRRRCGATLCDPMVSGHLSATILSLHGMPRLTKWLVGGTLMMMFSNITLPHLNEFPIVGDCKPSDYNQSRVAELATRAL
ncbi:hypothetical protein HKD37_10G030031 [Glycine soja]